MSSKLVSVIIPTGNRAEDLKKVLNSLVGQTYTNYEVIVVNKGPPSPKLEEICKMFLNTIKIKLLYESGGLTKAVNLGIRKSEGSIIVRTDDDVYATNKWLEELVASFTLGSNIAGATGPTIVPEEMIKNRDSLYFIDRMLKSTRPRDRFLKALYLYVLLENKWYHPGLVLKSGATTWGGAFKEYATRIGLTRVMFMSPANMAIRRDILDKIGLFDENYRGIGTFSEPDLALRILKRGYIMLYNPKAIVYHCPSRAGIFSSRFSTFDEGYNFLYFVYKNIIPYYGVSCLFKLMLNITFTSGYWLYLFKKTRKIKALGGFAGMIKALLKQR